MWIFRNARKSLTAAFVIVAAQGGSCGQLLAQVRSVSILIVRHAEVDSSQPAIPLSLAGRRRAELLVQTLRNVKFTHIFASHTTRSRQMVETIASVQNLTVMQFPKPGSVSDGQVINDQTDRRAAIEPVATALLQLPAGSTALASLNSENIFAILNRLGVPLAPSGQPCGLGSMCVPCTNNTCYPRDEYDHLWHLVREPGRAQPLTFIELRYAAGSRVSN